MCTVSTLLGVALAQARTGRTVASAWRVSRSANPSCGMAITTTGGAASTGSHAAQNGAWKKTAWCTASTTRWLTTVQRARRRPASAAHRSHKLSIAYCKRDCAQQGDAAAAAAGGGAPCCARSTVLRRAPPRSRLPSLPRRGSIDPPAQAAAATASSVSSSRGLLLPLFLLLRHAAARVQLGRRATLGRGQPYGKRCGFFMCQPGKESVGWLMHLHTCGELGLRGTTFLQAGRWMTFT